MTQLNADGNIASGIAINGRDVPTRLEKLDQDLPLTLDAMAPQLESSDIRVVAHSIETAILLLREARENLDEWEAMIPTLQSSAFFSALLSDPFTSHAYQRPRGYPGDAPLIDFIYGRGESRRAIADASDVGRRIYRYNWTSPACQAVRKRRCIAADFLAHAAIDIDRPRVLSIAAGHARELDELPGLLEECAEFVALDQDIRSLNTLKLAHPRVDTVSAGVRDIVHGIFDTRRFDIIYSLGLFDYLSDQVAIRLLSAVCSAGPSHLRVLIGNFVPEARDTGYMEAFMRWTLIYRTPEQMLSLAREAAPRRSARGFQDDSGQIFYLEIGPEQPA